MRSRRFRRGGVFLAALLMFMLMVPVAAPAQQQKLAEQASSEGAGAAEQPGIEISAEKTSSSDPAWWFWPLILFVITLVMGVLAVLGGVGGGVLFVPIISGFFRSISISCAAADFSWHWRVHSPPDRGC